MTRATALNGFYRTMREIWEYQAATAPDLAKYQRAERRAVKYARSLVNEHGFNVGTFPTSKTVNQVKIYVYEYSR